MSKLLVVVGATGNQGRSIIRWFQHNEPSWSIRGLTRNPSSKSAVALAHAGIEIVQADLNDVDSLRAAFRDANYIYAYTDFWGIVNSDAVMGKFHRGELEGSVVAEAFKVDLQQGKNIADAAAEVPSLERLVWSALPSATRGSKGKYTQVAHFDAKAAVTDYMLSLKALKGKASMLHLGAFMDNMVKKQPTWELNFQEDASALWQTVFPGDFSMPYIDVENDLGAFVTGLISAPAPKQVLAVSESMMLKEWLQLWSSTTGVKARFEQLQVETGSKDDPTGLQAVLPETSHFLQEFGFTGNDPDILTPEDLEKQGHAIPRTTVAEYMAREDWSKLHA